MKFSKDGRREGGGVVGGPDPLDEQSGLGGVVEDHGFDFAALAFVFEAKESQLCCAVGNNRASRLKRG